MGFSSLISEVVLANKNNYSDRRGMKVCKFTPHHMAGILTGKRCAELFQNPNRQASANYCIGNDGEIVGCVDEENRGWASANAINDRQAITVEVSNCEVGGQWRVSDKAWDSLVKLAYDVCKRYGFRLTYDGTPNGSLTHHNMFMATTCPGPYLQSRMKELAETVNKMLDEEPAQEEKTVQPTIDQRTKSIIDLAQQVIAGDFGNGEERKKRLGVLYNEVQNKVNEILSGKTVVEKKKSNEELADEVIKGLWGIGTDRKNRLTNAGYDYNAVQKIVNKKLL